MLVLALSTVLAVAAPAHAPVHVSTGPFQGVALVAGDETDKDKDSGGPPADTHHSDADKQKDQQKTGE